MNYNKSTDMELLYQWRDGDEYAGDQLFRRHYPSLLRFFQAKAYENADDLVQASMLACVECHHRFREASSFKSYLFGIARNQLSHYYRSNKVAKKRDAQDILDEVSREDVVHGHSKMDIPKAPDDAFSSERELRLLVSAIKRLPQQLQQVLQMAFWDLRTGPEIAAIISIPLDTAYSRLRRAKEKLRFEFERLEQSQFRTLEDKENLDAWAFSTARGLISDTEFISLFVKDNDTDRKIA